jgi:leishmanolysin
MKAVALIFLLASAVLSHGAGQLKTHKCIHDSKFKGINLKEMPQLSEHDARILQTLNPNTGLTGGFTGGSTTSPTANTPTVNDGWHQMRIFVDYSYGQKFSTANAAISAKYQMSMRLVESVRSYFEKYLSVNYSPSMVFNGGECYNNKVPAFNRPIDLYITIAPENNPNTDYFAAASPCYLSPRDGRPTMGAYILNFAFLETAFIYEYLYFSTFAHEFTHILGFSSSLFPKFVRPGTFTKRTDVVGRITIGSEAFNAITMPEVVNFARTYFNCPSISALPLENNGGDGSAGSHWEKLFLPQEYMNPTVENPGVLSDFTMTFLKATGWYQVDANAAQRYDWGHNAGCGIFNICPKGGLGYCTAAQNGQSVCSSEWTSKVCSILFREFVTKTELSPLDATSRDR